MSFNHIFNMKFVIVLSTVLFLVEGYFNMSFEKYNKCGCSVEYSCSNCAPCERYTPICTQNQTKIEDFHAEHLKSCSQWFLEGYNVELVNRIDGTITVTLFFSELKQVEQYGIELWILDDPSGNPTDNNSAPLNHSTKTLRVTRRKADSSCRLMVSFNFMFLYTGIYQLSLSKRPNLGEQSDSVSSACLSKPFMINSLYEKQILNDLEPSFLPVTRPQSYSLQTTMSGVGLNLAKKVFIRFSLCGERNVVMESHLKDVDYYKFRFDGIGDKPRRTDVIDGSTSFCVKNALHNGCTTELFFMSHFGNFTTGLRPLSTVVKLKSKIDLSLNDCSGSGNEVAKYIMHGTDGVCCDSYGVNQSSESCPCTFSDDFQKLTCTIQNLTNGNYCVIIGFYDPRCKPGTIWTKGASAFCSWSHNIPFVGTPTSMVITMPVKDNSGVSIILLCMLLIVTVISTVAVCWYRPRCITKLRHGINNYASTASSESSTIPWLIKDNCAKPTITEVLLLYPRDCFPFMNAMAEFRSLLRSNNCKVYDPWDNEIYNTVVESCETWSLPFIKNENIKIILVVSECSKRFEKAFLENTILGYKEPCTLDTIFTQSFAMIHQYFSHRFDSYKRIFVVQLEGSPPMNFDFITPGTLYSIPENVGYLIRDLRDREGNSQMVEFRLLTFMDAVAEYKYYMKANANYLNNLLSLRSCESTSAGTLPS